MPCVIVLDSPVGLVRIAATPLGVCSVSLCTRRKGGRLTQHARRAQCPPPRCDPRARKHALRMRTQLFNYFAGSRQRFSVALDLSGSTTFQRRVWRACARIPRGEVRSYAEVARTAGRPRAARAVGQAMAANPIPVVIPCHRVVRSDGSLGGYGLGIRVKRELLRLERSSAGRPASARTAPNSRS